MNHPLSKDFFWALCSSTLAVVALGTAPPAQGASSAEAKESLEAAAVERAFPLPDGVSLGGYANLPRRLPLPDLKNRFPFATWFRPSKGTRDPLRAKALLLRNADDEKLLFVSLELVAVSAGFRQDLLDALRPSGFDDTEVHVFATHTHSGPSGISDNIFWQVSATDRFQPALYTSLVEHTANTVREAFAALEPATLEAHTLQTEGIQRNRRRPAEGVDTQARLLLARRARGGQPGSYLGGFLNYALHGTALRPQSLRLSADAPGAISGVTEEYLWKKNDKKGPKPTILFLAGREGDVNPAHLGAEGLNTTTALFAQQLQAQFQGGHSVLPQWSITPQVVSLGKPSLSTRNCVLGTDLAFLGKLLPKLPVEAFFPTQTTVWNITLGGIPLLLWPGEPTTRLSALVHRSIAQQRNKPAPWVLSLANDYLAYFTTPQEFAEGGYEACLNLYGPEGGMRIVEALNALQDTN